jgi:hypothetical protein
VTVDKTGPRHTETWAATGIFLIIYISVLLISILLIQISLITNRQQTVDDVDSPFFIAP